MLLKFLLHPVLKFCAFQSFSDVQRRITHLERRRPLRSDRGAAGGPDRPHTRGWYHRVRLPAAGHVARQADDHRAEVGGGRPAAAAVQRRLRSGRRVPLRGCWQESSDVHPRVHGARSGQERSCKRANWDAAKIPRAPDGRLVESVPRRDVSLCQSHRRSLLQCLQRKRDKQRVIVISCKSFPSSQLYSVFVNWITPAYCVNVLCFEEVE